MFYYTTNNPHLSNLSEKIHPTPTLRLEVGEFFLTFVKNLKNINIMELGNLLFGNSRGEYKVDRNWNEDFYQFLKKFNIDNNGYYNGTDKRFLEENGGFKNDVFSINPYYWGEDKSILKLSNFIFEPMKYEIRWYKYPFRDSYSNKNISFKQFKEILNKCILSGNNLNTE